MSTGNIALPPKTNDVQLKKQRPLSTSFNELSRANSSARKDHGMLN